MIIDEIEEWREIPGYDGYQASSLGRLRSCKNFQGGLGDEWHPIKVTVRKADKYRCAALSSAPGVSKQKHLHQWIALAFFGEREAGQQVRHLDGDKANNRVTNLKYGTALENSMDRTTHGTQTRGEAHPRSKLSEQDVATIRDALGRGVPARACALVFNVNPTVISKIKRGELWAWLNQNQHESAAA